jgi:trehalose/maltose transport system substrate-binding protein
VLPSKRFGRRRNPVPATLLRFDCEHAPETARQGRNIDEHSERPCHPRDRNRSHAWRLWRTGDGRELFYVSGAVGNAVENFKSLVKPWEDATGHTVTIVPMPASTTDQFGQYRLWLAADASDIDLYQTDVIWAPQLADHFVDLTEAAKDLAPTHFPSIIESQTVNGKLVALPIFTDAPALCYRTDLLEKHGRAIPTTWAELTETAQFVQDAERAEGKADIWGFVWQGNAYEGLTCNALEWVKSFGGGQIVEADGTISINNENAVAALETVKGWVGTISPEGVLAYQEEEARGVWQTGNAVFMRNWPYAYGLGNGDDSAVKGLFGVTTLPVGKAGDTSAATPARRLLVLGAYADRAFLCGRLALVAHDLVFADRHHPLGPLRRRVHLVRQLPVLAHSGLRPLGLARNAGRSRLVERGLEHGAVRHDLGLL